MEPPGTTVSIEKFFTSNYVQIRKWAMEIVSYDRAASEDLIHDSYLKLMRLADKREIADPNAYVYVAMRNTYRSQLRLQSLLPVEQMPEAFSGYCDPSRVMSAFETLLEICEFACSRRTETVAASLFIFRYFLGYPPRDLSKIANRSRSAIDTRLTAFRREIQSLSLQVAFRSRGSDEDLKVWSDASSYDALQSKIFASKIGKCVSQTQMKRAFRLNSGGPDRDQLAHMTSCRKCLDAANWMLNIDLLAQRDPADALRGDAFGITVFTASASWVQIAVTALVVSSFVSP